MNILSKPVSSDSPSLINRTYRDDLFKRAVSICLVAAIAFSILVMAGFPILVFIGLEANIYYLFPNVFIISSIIISVIIHHLKEHTVTGKWYVNTPTEDHHRFEWEASMTKRGIITTKIKLSSAVVYKDYKSCLGTETIELDMFHKINKHTIEIHSVEGIPPEIYTISKPMDRMLLMIRYQDRQLTPQEEIEHMVGTEYTN